MLTKEDILEQYLNRFDWPHNSKKNALKAMEAYADQFKTVTPKRVCIEPPFIINNKFDIKLSFLQKIQVLFGGKIKCVSMLEANIVDDSCVFNHKVLMSVYSKINQDDK